MNPEDIIVISDNESKVGSEIEDVKVLDETEQTTRTRRSQRVAKKVEVEQKERELEVQRKHELEQKRKAELELKKMEKERQELAAKVRRETALKMVREAEEKERTTAAAASGTPVPNVPVVPQPKSETPTNPALAIPVPPKENPQQHAMPMPLVVPGPVPAAPVMAAPPVPTIPVATTGAAPADASVASDSTVAGPAKTPAKRKATDSEEKPKRKRRSKEEIEAAKREKATEQAAKAGTTQTSSQQTSSSSSPGARFSIASLMNEDRKTSIADELAKNRDILNSDTKPAVTAHSRIFSLLNPTVGGVSQVPPPAISEQVPVPQVPTFPMQQQIPVGQPVGVQPPIIQPPTTSVLSPLGANVPPVPMLPKGNSTLGAPAPLSSTSSNLSAVGASTPVPVPSPAEGGAPGTPSSKKSKPKPKPSPGKEEPQPKKPVVPAKVESSETDPCIVLDIPLSQSNDQEGQIVNVMKMCQEKFGWNGDKMVVDFDDDLEIEDDDEDDEEEPEPAPEGKKVNPQKGKSRIGKYDFEDPFIDDSELLWEEQRAATKDGFFVYYGPLIEKGKYAKFERIDGTLKRGGVTNPTMAAATTNKSKSKKKKSSTPSS